MLIPTIARRQRDTVQQPGKQLADRQTYGQLTDRQTDGDSSRAFHSIRTDRQTDRDANREFHSNRADR